jgi:hypothetical protein
MFIELSQIRKGVKARVVTVIPRWLQGVTAHDLKFPQREALRSVADLGSIDAAQHIRLTAAGSAGAGPAKFFQRDETFLPVAPGQGQFRAHDLRPQKTKRRGTHDKKLATMAARRDTI